MPELKLGPTYPQRYTPEAPGRSQLRPYGVTVTDGLVAARV